MAVKLEKSDFQKLTTILQNLSEFANERDRQRFLQGALAFEPRADNVLKHLDASGNPALAAAEVVQHFAKFGQLEPKREALAVLIKAMLERFGGGEEQDFLLSLGRRYPSLKITEDESQTAVVTPLRQPNSDADFPPGLRKFFDLVYEDLYRTPVIMLLAQDGMADGSVTQPLLERAQARFGNERSIHLSLSPGSRVDEFFADLAEQAGVSRNVKTATGFQRALHERLKTREDLFLLISGFERPGDNCCKPLAGVLRSLSEKFTTRFHVIILGGGKLADMSFRGELSLLNNAQRHHWAEPVLDDIGFLQQQSPGQPLSYAEAETIMEASGGHPGMIRCCLKQRAHNGPMSLQDYQTGLRQSDIAFQLWAPFRDEAAKNQLCDWLAQSDLGPAPAYIFDELLSRLYWRNLLMCPEDRLLWRCEALRELGRTIFRCA